MPRTLRLLAVILSPSVVGVFGLTGQTVCATSQLDWYTDVVGETPCTTYQRLRQICNSDYQVGTFNAKTPGDICNDQLSTCCCNSISFALSMLCMNCQYDTPTSPAGIDAAKGTYGQYLQTCGPIFNQTLASDIQAAVCNQNIKLENDLYSLFWDLGDWYYIYTKETMQKTFASTNNNSFTHCASTTVNDTQSGSPPPSSSSQSVTSSSLKQPAPPSSSTQSSTTQSAIPSSSSQSASLSSSSQSATTQSSFSSNSVQSVITSDSSSTSITPNTNTSSSSPSPSPSPTPLKSTAAVTSSKSNVGPMVGGIVGGVLGLAAIGLVLCFLLRKRRQNSSKESYDEDEDASRPFQEVPRGTSSIAGSNVMGSRSPPVPGSPVTDSSHGSAYGQRAMSSIFPVGGYDGTWRNRHEDGGPVAPSLHRSNSGSLPPEYQSEWMPSRAPGAAAAVGDSAVNEVTHPEEGSRSEYSGSGGSASGSDVGLVSRSRQRYRHPADVKRPLPGPS